MKKTLALAIGLSFSTLAAEAQITSGTKLLGGSINYSRSTSESTTNNLAVPPNQQGETVRRSFNVNPVVGTFVADNLAIGVALGYESFKAVYPYYGYSGLGGTARETSKSTNLSAAPFVRYYYLPVDNFGIYGQLTAGYSYQRSKTSNEGLTSTRPGSTGHGGFAVITPTLVFFPISKLGLELACGGIGYTRTTTKQNETSPSQFKVRSTESNFGANFRLDNLALGAAYYIGR